MVQSILSELRLTPPEALEALVDTAPFLMHSSDAEGRFLRMSGRWLDRLGYRLEDVVGRNSHGFLTPDSAARARRVKPRLIAEGAINDVELTFLSRLGAPVQVNLSGVAVFDEDGALLRTIAICFDTSRYASYREEVEARRTAERGQAAKSHLLAQISHEVRTPMNVIMGYMQLARSGDIGPAEAAHLDTALSAADTLMTQMTDMLDLSKAEAGRLSPQIAPFDIAAQLRKLADQQGPRIAARGLELKLELDPALPRVACNDCTRILQVLHNFISNAVKFTEKGSVTLRANCLNRTNTGWRVRIEVEDTGRGIPAGDQTHLFDAFSRGGDVEAVEGWGLGLSICKAMSQMLDADLGVRSEEGRGACFHLELDLARDETAPPEEIAPAPAPDSKAPRRSRLILVAEDNENSRNLLSQALVAMGHSVDSVGDGLAAATRCETVLYDAILMDMRMPRLRGDAAAARIRAEGLNRDTPIIAVTADLKPRNQAAYRDSGIDRMLPKPLDLDAVGGLLDRLETLRPA